MLQILFRLVSWKTSLGRIDLTRLYLRNRGAGTGVCMQTVTTVRQSVTDSFSLFSIWGSLFLEQKQCQLSITPAFLEAEAKIMQNPSDDYKISLGYIARPKKKKKKHRCLPDLIVITKYCSSLKYLEEGRWGVECGEFCRVIVGI